MEIINSIIAYALKGFLKLLLNRKAPRPKPIKKDEVTINDETWSPPRLNLIILSHDTW